PAGRTGAGRGGRGRSAAGRPGRYAGPATAWRSERPCGGRVRTPSAAGAGRGCSLPSLQHVRVDLPRLRERLIGEHLRQARDLAEPADLVGVQAELAADPLVGLSAAGELDDDVAHAVDRVLAAGPVVADGGGHAVGAV